MEGGSSPSDFGSRPETPETIENISYGENDDDKNLHEMFKSNKKIEIYRSIIYQTSIYSRFDPANNNNEDKKNESAIKKIFKKFEFTPLQWLIGLFPIIGWLSTYKWRTDLYFDLIAGFTVAVFNIPQGMAYALLGNLPPIIGIYMAFFPVIIYSIMGTSRHLAVGTFAVVSLMSGKVIISLTEKAEADFIHHPEIISNSTTGNSSGFDSEKYAIQVAAALSIAVGFFQVGLGLLRLGAISVLLFTEVVSGFTTGAAIHVITSQIKGIFGLKLHQQSGFFNIIKTYIDVFKNIGDSNVTAIIISAITIVSLTIYNELLKPRIAKKIPFPLPVELVAIIIGTLVSKYWEMNERFNLSIVGKIPTGLPAPTLPRFSIVGDLIIDGLLIAVVSYAISVSVAKIFAQKHGYKIDANQELLAHGSSNIVGSFFSCSPSSASLTRCVINETVGARTQLAGLFCAGILLVVLLWIAPFFETVPNCVLAGMIVVALKNMLLQVLDCKKAWHQSKINGVIWALTFLATVILDIEYGLGMGLVLSIASLLWRSNRPYINVLGSYDNTGLFIDIKNGKEMVQEYPERKIIKFTGSLNFATIDYYSNKVKELVPIEQSLKKMKKSKKKVAESTQVLNISVPSVNHIEFEKEIKWIILDFSSVSSIDPIASKGLLSLVKEYGKISKNLIFSGFSPNLLETLHVCGLIKEIEPSRFFPTILDALSYTEIAILTKNDKNINN